MHSNNIGKQITKLKQTKNKLIIRFSDKSKLIAPLDLVKKYKLKENKILSKQIYKNICNEIILSDAKSYLISITKKHSYTSLEIERKLIKRNLNNYQIKQLINYLKKNNLLNDNCYISEYIRYYSNRNYSINRIKKDLIAKGISINEVNKIQMQYEDEYRKAKAILLNRIKYMEGYSYKLKKEKLFNCLYIQQFNINLIEDVIKDNLIYSYELEIKSLRKEYSIIYVKYSYKYLGDLLYEKVIEYLLRKGYSFNDIKLIEREYKDETS